MKKILLIALTLATSVGLVACGNTDNSNKKSNTKAVKTEQHKVKSDKDSKKDNNSASATNTKDNSNNEKTNDESTAQPAQNQESQTQPQAEQPVRSQKDEQNGMGNVVTNPSQAIEIVSNALGNNSDLYYHVISTENHMYEVQVTSKSIKAQGGTGTVGLYDVMEDGTYSLR